MHSIYSRRCRIEKDEQGKHIAMQVVENMHFLRPRRESPGAAGSCGPQWQWQRTGNAHPPTLAGLGLTDGGHRLHPNSASDQPSTIS